MPVDGSGRGGQRSSSSRRSTTRSRKPRTWVAVDEYGEPIPLSPEQTVRLRERALNLCLWHLGQGPRTRQQLVGALSGKGVPSDMADDVVAQLEEYRYVDDGAFAESYVRSRHEGQRKGSRAIRMELLRKGVDAETVAVAMEQVTEDGEQANAEALVARKLPSTRGLDRGKRVNRLVGMLTRRGYSPGLAFSVVRAALEGEGDLEEDFPTP